jgi:hypothetical protein
MKTDPDFSKVTLKLNASGSWCNVGVFRLDDYDRVKTASLILAECTTGRLKFKLVDAEGGELEFLECKQPGGLNWRKPGGGK